MPSNKIKYGISHCYYAVGTPGSGNTMTYGTPVALPGAVSLSLDQNGGQTTFYADNVAYYVGVANNGYTGSLELARIPESFETDVLGNITDDNDVSIEDAAAKSVHFALLFQFEGDVKETKHVLYNCVAARPSVSGSTKEDSIEPQTETIDITATPIYDETLKTDIVKAKTTDSVSTATDAGWFSTVYTPVSTS